MISCGINDLASQGAREETPVDVEKARQEAQELHDAGAKQWGTDGSKFSQVIAERSFQQLRAIFDEYAKVRSKMMFVNTILRSLSICMYLLESVPLL